MNIIGYCRVSTDTSDQLNSLETQKQFFEEYAKKNGHNLVRVYADEGISGNISNNNNFTFIEAYLSFGTLFPAKEKGLYGANGFIIKYGNILQNCTIDNIFEGNEQLFQDKVNELLFKEGRTT